MNLKKVCCSILIVSLVTLGAKADEFKAISFQSKIENVQPMTGIVMWGDSKNSHSDAIQLEFSYLKYSDVVKGKDRYDWKVVEKILNRAKARKHQAVLRFWDTYPGKPSGMPAYFKNEPGYKMLTAESENRDTGFPDWSHAEPKKFVLEFYEKFAERYDNDPRLAFLEVGFGLWAEYHIYSGPEIPGKTFPGRTFQATFVQHMDKVMKVTPWMISKDAHAKKRSPFATQPELLKLDFGIFDDTFHLAWKPGYNLDGAMFFGRERYKRSPIGGEILFPDKKHAQFVAEHWQAEARNFGISFMICEQWPKFTTMKKIQEHGMVCGYKFKILSFEASSKESRVTVMNTGVAPIYFDAYVAVNSARAATSLKGLQPGEQAEFSIAAGGKAPKLSIECDRLVTGQRIEMEADLK